jgi:hypothetical protein
LLSRVTVFAQVQVGISDFRPVDIEILKTHAAVAVHRSASSKRITLYGTPSQQPALSARWAFVWKAIRQKNQSAPSLTL